MKVLLTGHKGFIGTQILLTLNETGIQPVGLDLGDRLVEDKYEYIIHMGARTLIRNSLNAPFEYFNDNLALSMKFLEMARKQDSNIVIPTSGSIQKPSNPYSLSKRHIEDWINLYRELYGVKVFLLRFFNIYGPTSRKGAVFLFTKAALCGEEVTIYGDGNHVRDFVHVRDVAKLVVEIVNGRLIPGTYEVGTGVGTSVRELLQLVQKVTGKEIRTAAKSYVLEEADRLVASTPIIHNFIPLEAGIADVYDSLKIKIPCQ